MFVPTSDLQLPEATTQRRQRIREVIAVLRAADGYLSVAEIHARAGLNRRFVDCLAKEMAGEWLLQRTDATDGFQYAAPEAWVVDGCASTVVHSDPDCRHLWTFDHRPAVGEEADTHDECGDCAGGTYRASDQDWSVYQAAVEAADD